MIGLDLDGTLVNYDSKGDDNRVNESVVRRLKGLGQKSVVVVTDQPGIAFSRHNRNKYPTAQKFFDRIDLASRVLASIAKVQIAKVHVCLFWNNASQDDMDWAESELRKILDENDANDWVVITKDPEYRKPNPGALVLAGVDTYYGDSEADEQAAQAAGIKFHRVERFS